MNGGSGGLRRWWSRAKRVTDALVETEVIDELVETWMVVAVAAVGAVHEAVAR